MKMKESGMANDHAEQLTQGDRVAITPVAIEQLALRVGVHPCDGNVVFAVDAYDLEVSICLAPTITVLDDVEDNMLCYMVIVGADKPLNMTHAIQAIGIVAKSLKLDNAMDTDNTSPAIAHQPGYPQQVNEDGIQTVFTEGFMLLVPVSELRFNRTVELITLSATAATALTELRALKRKTQRKLSDAMPPTNTIQ